MGRIWRPGNHLSAALISHITIILAYFMRWYINFLAWRQRIISLVCLANNVIHTWPQVMPIFDWEMPPGFTLAIFYVEAQLDCGPEAKVGTARKSESCHPENGIPPDCVCLTENLALEALRLFPRPLWFHATECCGALGREPVCITSKVCQLCDCVDRLAQARHASLQPDYSYFCRVRYRCLVVRPIWDGSRI